MRGVTSHDRIDEELYQDYETEEAKQVRGWLWTGWLTCAAAAAGWLGMGGCLRRSGWQARHANQAQLLPGVADAALHALGAPLAQKRLAREAKELEKLEKAAAKVRWGYSRLAVGASAPNEPGQQDQHAHVLCSRRWAGTGLCRADDAPG